MIADIANNVMAREGRLHPLPHREHARTFQEFRAGFGSTAGAHSDSDTNAVTIDDPPAQIAAACAAVGTHLYQDQFPTKLFFGPLRDDEWRAFKNPQAYDVLANSNPSAYEDLKRLYFVIQRAPLEFAADHSSTGLESFMDQIRAVIERNHGVLPSMEGMQVFTRAEAPADQAEAIPQALADSIRLAA